MKRPLYSANQLLFGLASVNLLTSSVSGQDEAPAPQAAAADGGAADLAQELTNPVADLIPNSWVGQPQVLPLADSSAATRRSTS